MSELKSGVAQEHVEDYRADVCVVDAFSPEALDAIDALYLKIAGGADGRSAETSTIEVTMEHDEYTRVRVPSDSMELESHSIQEATSAPRPDKKSKYKKRKQKRQAAQAVADPTVLKEFVEQGINGQGLSTVKPRIVYKMIDEFSDIRRQMAKPHGDVGSIQVLTHAHNCIHASNGFSRSIFREVANLASADHETQKTSYKLGKFSVAAYNVRGQETKLFVHSLYVQFCLGVPNRGAPENNMHVVPRAVRAGLRSIFKMHSESNHGLVIFGDDTHYPTDWSIIETQIEELCEQLDRTITIFVPRSYVASCKQKLDGRLAPFLRKAGMLI